MVPRIITVVISCSSILFRVGVGFPCTILKSEFHHRRFERATIANKTIFRPPRSFTSKNLWKDGVIPYRFHSNYSEESKSIVQRAIKRLERYTCVRFVPVTQHKRHHLLILDGRECSSFVGKQPRTLVQELSLPPWCLQRRDGVLHELLHVLGFGHEQTRLDRGAFVDVNWKNVPSRFWFAFHQDLDAHIKLGYSVPYDYGSILHYGPYDFARVKSERTLTSRQRGFDVNLNRDLSYLDVFKINLLYKCRSHLNSMSKACLDFERGCGLVSPEDCTSSTYTSTVCRKTCGLC